MAQQQMAKEERSLGDLFADLARDTSTLVRQEVALAQTEMTHKATKAGKNIGFLVVGGAVAYAAVLAMLAGVIILLSMAVPAWASAFIVAAVVGIVAYFMISSALAGLKRTDPVPHRTVETIKEDAKWLKREVT
jgi:MFS family permease